MRRTSEEMVQEHARRFEAAAARAQKKIDQERRRLTDVYARALKALGTAAGQTDVEDMGPIDAALTKLRDLHARSCK